MPCSVFSLMQIWYWGSLLKILNLSFSFSFSILLTPRCSLMKQDPVVKPKTGKEKLKELFPVLCQPDNPSVRVLILFWECLLNCGVSSIPVPLLFVSLVPSFKFVFIVIYFSNWKCWSTPWMRTMPRIVLQFREWCLREMGLTVVGSSD